MDSDQVDEYREPAREAIDESIPSSRPNSSSVCSWTLGSTWLQWDDSLTQSPSNNLNKELQNRIGKPKRLDKNLKETDKTIIGTVITITETISIWFFAEDLDKAGKFECLQ